MLTQLPFQVDVPPIAAGILAMFEDSERAALQFGLLPADKINALERMLKNKFREFGLPVESPDHDLRLVHFTDGREPMEFSVKEAVKDVVHEITLELYRIGDLVV